MVNKIENPFEDPAYNRGQYERDKELMARGINPYCKEENIMCDKDEGLEEVDLIELFGTRKEADAAVKKLENRISQNKKKILKGKNNGLKYLLFLEDARKIEVSGDNFEEYVQGMKDVLKEYFPRFREGGSQDLEAREYEAIDIWKIYQKISDYARKVQKEFRGY